MIKYQFPEEKEFLLFFAKDLADELSQKIILNEQISTKEEAEHFSRFYWKMVDRSIELEKGGSHPWPKGSQFWCEKVSHSISGFINRSGFRDIWDKVVYEQ